MYNLKKKLNSGGDYYLYHILFMSSIAIFQTTTCSGGNVGSVGGS